MGALGCSYPPSYRSLTNAIQGRNHKEAGRHFPAPFATRRVLRAAGLRGSGGGVWAARSPQRYRQQPADGRWQISRQPAGPRAGRWQLAAQLVATQ